MFKSFEIGSIDRAGRPRQPFFMRDFNAHTSHGSRLAGGAPLLGFWDTRRAWTPSKPAAPNLNRPPRQSIPASLDRSISPTSVSILFIDRSSNQSIDRSPVPQRKREGSERLRSLRRPLSDPSPSPDERRGGQVSSPHTSAAPLGRPWDDRSILVGLVQAYTTRDACCAIDRSSRLIGAD